jgi:hypothetical protein
MRARNTCGGSKGERARLLRRGEDLGRLGRQPVVAVVGDALRGEARPHHEDRVVAAVQEHVGEGAAEGVEGGRAQQLDPRRGGQGALGEGPGLGAVGLGVGQVVGEVPRLRRVDPEDAHDLPVVLRPADGDRVAVVHLDPRGVDRHPQAVGPGLGPGLGTRGSAALAARGRSPVAGAWARAAGSPARPRAATRVHAAALRVFISPPGSTTDPLTNPRDRPRRATKGGRHGRVSRERSAWRR